jgi:hypothetical protein
VIVIDRHTAHELAYLEFAGMILQKNFNVQRDWLRPNARSATRRESIVSFPLERWNDLRQALG